jgi:hypothetical protein
MLRISHKKQPKGRNYEIDFGFGNEYFQDTKTRGIVELMLNGVVIRIIPNFDFSKYPFPPQTQDLLTIHNSDSKFKNVHHRRFYAFYLADIVFFELSERAGTSQELIFKYPDGKRNFPCLVHFINTEDYQKLVSEIRLKMPSVLSNKNLTHRIRKNDIADFHFVQFVDAKLIELKEQLTIDIREELGL